MCSDDYWERDVELYQVIIVDLFISPFVHFSSSILRPCYEINFQAIHVLVMNHTLIVMTFFMPGTVLCSEVYFLWYHITWHNSFLLISVFMVYSLHPLSLLLWTGLCFLSIIWSTFLADSIWLDVAFSIYSEHLCILTGLFITSTFNVIINMVGLNLQLVCFLCSPLFYSLFPLFFFFLPFGKIHRIYDFILSPFWLTSYNYLCYFRWSL